MSNSPTSPVLTLGYRSIADAHPAFHTLLEPLQKADNVAFPTLFAELQAGTQQHFVFSWRLP